MSPLHVPDLDHCRLECRVTFSIVFQYLMLLVVKHNANRTSNILVVFESPRRLLKGFSDDQITMKLMESTYDDDHDRSKSIF